MFKKSKKGYDTKGVSRSINRRTYDRMMVKGRKKNTKNQWPPDHRTVIRKLIKFDPRLFILMKYNKNEDIKFSAHDAFLE
jgi:hypothetical protein